ncbi:MFS transporter [Neisseria perflava]|uniref:MFS transporter n=1 Tax=Neisseria perflava TaxID=33053 RepID=UPI00209D6EAF|nr:MFS transporter [Neisseria perflava]MCP1660683.1 DHA2 family lincomycin resistance protein-like MFS transporter [Neisseria perflava]MCP1771869.1 DHA2 family lincomycin resistance protein-like MFS transporter [Neisseria perflava]
MHTSDLQDSDGQTAHEYFADNPDFPAKTIIATLFIGAFFGFLNDTLLNVALTRIMQDFGVDKTTVQWLTTGFLLVMGAFTPITAAVIQWIETRKMVLLTQAVFLAGSLICAFSPTFGVLLAGRMVQAVSAAFFVPLLFNGVLSIYPPSRRGTAMGVITMMFTAAPALGPTLSGIIIDHSHWRVLFAFIVPFMLVAMWLVNKYLTVNLSNIGRPKIDVLSALLSIAGFGGLVYASSNFAHLPLAEFILLFTVSLVLVGWFAHRQFRLATPLLNLRAFQYTQFGYCVVILGISGFLFLGMELLMPMYTQQVLLLTGTATGLILMPASIAQAVAAPLFGKLLDKKGGRFVVLPATVLLVAALAILWAFLRIDTQVVMLSAMFTLFAVSVSACMTGETHGLNALPKTLNPHGAAIITTLNPISGAVGAAFFVGVTNIGEKLSSAASPQQAMLDGIHLAMGSALVLGALMIFCAARLKADKK